MAPVPAQGGYTHYFIWHRKPDLESLRACIAEMRELVEASRNLVEEVDDGRGRLNSKVSVAFNGIGEEMMHEDFIFPGGSARRDFNFCKTAGKPYDAVVTACLIAARDHFPPEILDIRSDGNWELGDWEDGAELYCRVLGRPARSPMPLGPYTPRSVDSVPQGIRSVLIVLVVGLIVAGVICLSWPKPDFTITANEKGIELNGRIPQAKRRNIVLFFVREFGPERHLRIAGRWRKDRRLQLRARGVTALEQQRIRNFLLTEL
jgi:hypothetical protein